MTDPIPAHLTPVEADALIPLERWGSAVRLGRKNLAMTQDQLAGHVGVTQQTISKVERGRVVPTDRTKVRLAHALGAHPGHLFGWWDHTDQQTPSLRDRAIRPDLAGPSEWRPALDHPEVPR